MVDQKVVRQRDKLCKINKSILKLADQELKKLKYKNKLAA